ncbi:MAG: hypothetical protein OXG46_07280 [Chloroflexi bacterium]|nr:hypothetical protein [Chloroflexota bacterium]MCY3936766.1 hypothetical protein [Chloroflexota bacterium]
MRKQHGVCADRNERAKESIKTLCVDAALRGADLDGLRPRIRETAAGGFVEISESKMKRTLAAGWRNAVVEAMEDHVLSTPEKRGLNRYRAQFDLAEKQLNRAGHFELFTKMALLNSLMEHGVIPRTDRRRARTRFGRLPFNMMKSEGLVWMFNNVGYMQQITRREHRGQSMGMSFRVAKGVYVRPGTFRGQSVSTTSMEHTDSGVLGVTTKHIYFKGSEKSFRVRLEKIVSFDPYQDGLGIMRDTASAKPEIFTMKPTDAWFSINLIEALLDIEDLKPPGPDAVTLDEIVDEMPDDREDDAGLFIAGTGASL